MDSQSTSQTSANSALCRCGHDRTHMMVSPVGRYNLVGWFWVTVMGVTTKPIRVDYKCRSCSQIFDSSTDEKDLKNHA
jgi:hypothetical protein